MQVFALLYVVVEIYQQKMKNCFKAPNVKIGKIS